MSTDNPDIRQQVKEQSGALKRLQTFIPGLRGYRRSEDVRISDELLRNQIADRLLQAKGNLEQLRRQIVAAGDFTNLNLVGSAISQLQQFAGELRHSEQGYSGLAPSISITEDTLNKLYEYDYDFVSSAYQLLNSTASFIYDPSAPNQVSTFLNDIMKSVQELRRKWELRIEAAEGILLK